MNGANAQSAGQGLLRMPMYVRILVGLALGVAAGLALGERAAALGELGKLVIQLLKAAATPLLFFAIVRTVLETELRGRAALRLLGFATLNASLALAIGLGVSNFFEPGRALAAAAPPDAGTLAAYADKRIDLVATLSGIVPVSFVAPFAENLVLSIVLVALLVGFGLRRVRSEGVATGDVSHRGIEQAVATLLRLMEVMLGWVIALIPLAVFGVVAKSVGEYGFAPLRGLAAYLAAGLGGLALHALLVYHAWLLLVLKLPLARFWREAREPVIAAIGTNSSLATLPVTLRALDRLGVPRSASALGACVGTNFNNDGIILYEGMAVLFVAQASGIDLSLGQQLVVALTCLVAAMGVAGVPEAGFVSLALVLNTAGLPIELLPLLLTVDWIVARGRSIVNVLSDMLLSLLVARGESGAPDPAPESIA